MIIGLVVGLLILAGAIYFAYQNRYNIKKCIGWITGGVFGAIVALILPTQWVQEGSSVSSPLVFRIVSALDYSFKALAGQPEIIQVESSPLEGCLRSFVATVTLILLGVAPVLASGFIVSLIGDSIDRFRYWICRKSKCCVFSELNENSLALAQNLKKINAHQAIVFCGVSQDANETLVTRARTMRAILLHKPCTALLPFRKKKTAYDLYLTAENKAQNVSDAEAVIREIKAMSEINVKTIVFTQDRMSITILEDAVQKALKKNSKDRKFRMVFVDEIALFCNDLVFRHPLYNLPKDRKDISVMIVGCGAWGMQMLKTVLGSGIISGYPLHIRVYDKRADYVEGAFYCQCPEIKNLLVANPSVQLSFISADVTTSGFFDQIKENGGCDATYVCVSTDSDSINLTTAENLYRFFRRQNGFADTPPIFARVKDGLLSGNVSDQDASYLQARKIELFGTSESFYGNTALLNSKLERLALGVHLAYATDEEKKSLLDCYLDHTDGKDGTPSWKNAWDDALDSFYGSEYNRRSSMASALHFGAKLFTASNVPVKFGEITEDHLTQYEAAVQDPTVCDKIIRNEHDRWCFFMATEGWRTVTIDEMKMYYKRNNNDHRDKLSKSQPCIIPFDDLDALSDVCNQLHGPGGKEDFAKKDESIILALPKIIRFAEQYHE